jgi:hypothetical protein
MTTTPRLFLNEPVIGDNVDVVLTLRHQFSRLDDVADAFVCTSLTRPSALLFDGQLIYETDTANVMRYDSGTTSWKLFSHGRNPLGRMAFVSSTAASSGSVSGTQELGPYLTVSFNGKKNRVYQFHWVALLDHQTGSNTSSRWIVIRADNGHGTVTQSSNIAQRMIADVDDNATGFAVRQSGSDTYVPSADGVITMGLFLQATSGSNQTIIKAGSYNTLSVEDIGALV